MRANTHAHIHTPTEEIHRFGTYSLGLRHIRRTSFPQKSARMCVCTHCGIGECVLFFFPFFPLFATFFRYFIYSIVCHKFCVSFSSPIFFPHSTLRTHILIEMRIVGTRRIYSSVAIVFFIFKFVFFLSSL